MQPFFSPTHVIRTNDQTIKVQLESNSKGFGPAYTRQEYESAETADYEYGPDGWLFQGKPFVGTVKPIRQYVAVADHVVYGFGSTERKALKSACQLDPFVAPKVATKGMTVHVATKKLMRSLDKGNVSCHIRKDGKADC